MCNFPGVDSKGSAGAPDEIETVITEVMIDAGASVLSERLIHDPLMSPSLARSLAEDVILAALVRNHPEMRTAYDLA
jgi:hypothetical protein